MKNRGVALVDMGGGSTTLSIFKDGELQATSVLPLGGDHITKDIAIGLKTSTENADQIKLKYGHAFMIQHLKKRCLRFLLWEATKQNNILSWNYRI